MSSGWNVSAFCISSWIKKSRISRDKTQNLKIPKAKFEKSKKFRGLSFGFEINRNNQIPGSRKIPKPYIPGNGIYFNLRIFALGILLSDLGIVREFIPEIWDFCQSGIFIPTILNRCEGMSRKIVSWIPKNIF